MASRSRAMPRMLRHSGLGWSLAGFIAVGFALVLGLTAVPSVFPRTQSPVAPAATPVRRSLQEESRLQGSLDQPCRRDRIGGPSWIR